MISSYVPRGDRGIRERMQSLYISPQEQGRQNEVYGGNILESSGQEAWLRAQLQFYEDMLQDADPRVTPHKVDYIRAEIDKLTHSLMKLSEGVGAEAVQVAGQIASDKQQQAQIYGNDWAGWEQVGRFYPGEMGFGGYEGMQSTNEWYKNPGGYFSTMYDAPKSLGSMGSQVADRGQQAYQMPSYMTGWMTPAGARPIGAQTSMDPVQKQALWEQIAMNQAGTVTNLQDYIEKVEPFISTWGQAHDAASKRLTPKTAQRSAAWAAARQ